MFSGRTAATSSVDLNTSDKQWLYLIQENSDLIGAIEDLIPTIDQEAITEAQAVADPTDPAWSGDQKLATVGAINRLFSQIVGLGSGFPGDGNLGFNGKLRIDNVSGATPDLYFWDAEAQSPAWVQVNTKGDQGPPGPPGPPPGLQTPAAVATTVPNKGDGSVGEATAAVTADGNGDLQFSFGVPQGEVGPQGPPGDGVNYLGPIDATTAAEPTDPKNGDFYVNTTNGTSTWTGLSTVAEQDRLVFNGATLQWDRYESLASRTNLSYQAAADKGTIVNDNGYDAVILTVDSSHAGLMVPAEHDKLAGIEAGAQANVNADWNASGGDAQILNKPEVKQSDWLQSNTSQVDYIRNKPNIPAAQIQSDYIQTDTSAVDFIKNKPTIGDGEINFNAGDGLSQTGNNATSNQTGNTTKTFSVKAADSSITVDSNGIKVNVSGMNYLPTDGGNLTGGVTQTMRTITAGSFDLSTGNLWNAGGITIPNPTNAVAGMSGLIVLLGAPTGWGGNFDFPGGNPPTVTTVPAVVPFMVMDAGTILMGNVIEGIS